LPKGQSIGRSSTVFARSSFHFSRTGAFFTNLRMPLGRVAQVFGNCFLKSASSLLACVTNGRVGAGSYDFNRKLHAAQAAGILQHLSVLSSSLMLAAQVPTATRTSRMRAGARHLGALCRLV
jgi:hypothetical protein